MIVEVFPVLLGNSKNGKMKEWRIYIENDSTNDIITIVTMTGYIDGKKTEHRKEIKSGKNIGKTNETSIYEQAKQEALSTWKDKIKRGGYYQGPDALSVKSNVSTEVEQTNVNEEKEEEVESVPKKNSQKKKGKKKNEEEEENDDSENLMPALIYPMLAQKWTLKKSIEKETFIQPKLDGVRCMSRFFHYPEEANKPDSVLLLSRTGQPYYHLDKLREMIFKFYEHPSIKAWMEEYGPFWLDGELYRHGTAFQKITSIVRKKKISDSDSDLIQYHIYDIYVENSQELPFSDRSELLECFSAIYKELDPGFEKIQFVKTEKIDPTCNLLEKHNVFVDEGYEGMMIRYGRGIYLPKYRSNELLKYKLFEDHEYKIVDFKESAGIPGTIQFICEYIDKKKGVSGTFTTDMKGPFEERKIMFEKALKSFDKTMKGKKLTVQHQGYTDSDVPRFPKGKAIRDYE